MIPNCNLPFGGGFVSLFFELVIGEASLSLGKEQDLPPTTSTAFTYTQTKY